MSGRGQYLHERRLRAGEPIDAYRDRDYEDLPSVAEILGGLLFMAALAAGFWLLLFAQSGAGIP